MPRVVEVSVPTRPTRMERVRNASGEGLGKMSGSAADTKGRKKESRARTNAKVGGEGAIDDGDDDDDDDDDDGGGGERRVMRAAR